LIARLGNFSLLRTDGTGDIGQTIGSGLPGFAVGVIGIDRSGGGNRASRRRLRGWLAPRSLWRMPPDVQLPARLAFRAVRAALLPELVRFALIEQGPRIAGPCFGRTSRHFVKP